MPERRGPIAPPGYPFILGGLLTILLGWALHYQGLSFIGLAALAFFAYFFRDPERPIPRDEALIVAPADGKVIFQDEWVVEEEVEGQMVQGPAKRLAIFMNVFDVHVNRSPFAGTVAAMGHRPGRFMAAFRPEAGSVNEQLMTVLHGANGRRALVVQIAGLLARRIVPFVVPGQDLARGERLGMICFGSRVDLYLPPETELLVKVGDRVKAGSSIVARWG